MHDRGPGQSARHPAGLTHLTVAGKFVHAPVRVGMEDARARSKPRHSPRDLRRRSRDPVPEGQSRRGIAATARGHGQAEAHGQQGEDTHLQGTGRGVRLPGYTFGRMHSARTGQARLGHRPSRKSIKHAVEKVHVLTVRSGTWQETTELVKKLNRTLRGWANYFQVGTVNKAYRALDNYTAVRLRRWLRAPSIKSDGVRAEPIHSRTCTGTSSWYRLSKLGHDVPWVKA